jgi:hypothetical protein
MNHKTRKISMKNDKWFFTIVTKKFIINSLVFLMLFLPLRLLNCYVVVYPEANNIGKVAYIRKILSLLVCSYYSLYFLVHIFIIKHVRETIDKTVKNRSNARCQNLKTTRLVNNF